MPTLAKSKSKKTLSVRPAVTPAAPSAGSDLKVNAEVAGVIELRSRTLFGSGSSETSRKLIERAFLAPEVRAVEIHEKKHRVRIEYAYPEVDSCREIVRRISSHLAKGSAAKPIPAARRNGSHHVATASADELIFASDMPAHESVVRVQRTGNVISTWAVRHHIPGRIRLHNPVLFRKRELAQEIDRELMGVLGIERYQASELTATVLIHYNPKRLQSHQIVEILDSVLHKALQAPVHRPDLDLAIASSSMVFAIGATLWAPILVPAAALLFIYSVIPSFKSAYKVLFEEKRLGVDVLDSIVVLACLATGHVLAGTVLAFSLAVGRKLLQKTEDDSKKTLLNIFGKQPRFVWLYKDGIEIEVPLDKLQVGDVVVVHTGEVVPIDGIISSGMAMIDQHTLTGESAPAEKVKGDRVFASTIMLAGKINVEVTSAGSETTSAKIAQILNDTAGYKLKSQSRGEELADKAVIPTLAVASLGLGTVGVMGATAIVNCDFGTGIRMAAPLGMLTSLTLCAQHGILVKDGRALDLMRKVDTVLFDKTGTLTRERPEVGRVLTSTKKYSANQILTWAAAAEHKFTHPIAKAILDKFESLGLPLPATDESQYHVGYGITVGCEGHKIRVGSVRFLKQEGIAIPQSIDQEVESVYADGNSLIMVAVDDELGGAIEMCASHRPEVEEIIAGLRARGIKHIAIISGDHDRPTRKLAERLKVDRYFAEVLPADKAKYVELLQSEGKTVCFVGDGINDSIALKTANVSISLRGASSIATDTAHVVFMEESLAKLLALRDISLDLEKNISRSWGMIVVPNAVCIGGAFLFGFGIMHSMVFNQLGGLAALVNGLLPLRKAAAVQAKKDRETALELENAIES